MRPPIHPCQRVADAASDSPYDSPVALTHTHTQSQHPATIQNRHSRTLTTSTYNPATAGWHPVTHSHVQPVRQTQPTRQPAATRQQPIDRQPAATRLPPLPDPPTPSRTRASPLLHGPEGELSPGIFLYHSHESNTTVVPAVPPVAGAPMREETLTQPAPRASPTLTTLSHGIGGHLCTQNPRAHVPRAPAVKPSAFISDAPRPHRLSSHALAIAAHSFREAQSASRSVKKESQCLTF